MPSETQTAPEILELRHVFRAPRTRVFDAFTDPKTIAGWFGPQTTNTEVVELSLHVGGTYRFNMHLADGNIAELVGTYLEIEPPERLVYTWGWVGGTTTDSEVTLQFQNHDDGTELLLSHRKLPDEEQRKNHGMGWSSSFECLEELLRGGS